MVNMSSVHPNQYSNVMHHNLMSDYLYDVCFRQGQYADVTVMVPSLGLSFALHSLILAQSPMLKHQLESLDASRVLNVDMPSTTMLAITLVLGDLYRPLTFFQLDREISGGDGDHANDKGSDAPSLLFSLLDCASFLERPSLKDIILAVMRSRFTSSSIHQWISLLDRFRKQGKSWVNEVDEQLVSFLVVGLSPVKAHAIKLSGRLVIGDHEAHGYMISKLPLLPLFKGLADTYASLPANYLKRCLEHRDLPVQDNFQRFHFIKHVLLLRRREHDKADLTMLLNFDQADDAAPPIQVIPPSKAKFGKWDPSLYE